MIDTVTDSIRRVVEDCDSLQGFILFRAFGGGTGSGFTSLLLDNMCEEYGKMSKFDFSIYPSPRISPLIVEPYNAVLTTHGTIESEDLCFVMDNEACYKICEKLLDVPRPTYTNLNRLVAQVSRFQCPGSKPNIAYYVSYIPTGVVLYNCFVEIRGSFKWYTN